MSQEKYQNPSIEVSKGKGEPRPKPLQDKIDAYQKGISEELAKALNDAVSAESKPKG